MMKENKKKEGKPKGKKRKPSVCCMTQLFNVRYSIMTYSYLYEPTNAERRYFEEMRKQSCWKRII